MSRFPPRLLHFFLFISTGCVCSHSQSRSNPNKHAIRIVKIRYTYRTYITSPICLRNSSFSFLSATFSSRIRLPTVATADVSSVFFIQTSTRAPFCFITIDTPQIDAPEGSKLSPITDSSYASLPSTATHQRQPLLLKQMLRRANSETLHPSRLSLAPYPATTVGVRLVFPRRLDTLLHLSSPPSHPP